MLHLFTTSEQSETSRFWSKFYLISHQLDHHHPFLRAGPEPASMALPAGAAPAGELGAGAATAGRMAVGGGSRLSANLAALRLSSSSMRFLILSKSCLAQHAQHPCNHSQTSSAASISFSPFNTFHPSMAPCLSNCRARLLWTAWIQLRYCCCQYRSCDQLTSQALTFDRNQAAVDSMDNAAMVLR